jgi:multiple sugar transport system ATP-binding protein
MIYVTHDQEEAQALGDRVAVLERGRVRQVAAPGILYRRPAHRFVAGFIGFPPMSLLDGQLAWNDGRLALAAGKSLWPLPGLLSERWQRHAGSAVTVGIRSETVQLGEAPGGAALSMTVAAVEPLGADSLIVLRHDGWQVTVRRPLSSTPATGDTVAVGWHGQDAFLFDQATGQLLCPALAEED